MGEKSSMPPSRYSAGKPMKRALWSALCALMSATVASPAQTYLSVEPIPSPYIVGQDDLRLIMDIGYPNMESWSKKLDENCHLITRAVQVLQADGATKTLVSGSFVYQVGAGGSDGGATDPSYVFSVKNQGTDAVSDEDLYRLDNALGFVLNQTDNDQFTVPYRAAIPHETKFEYARVTFANGLTGVEAANFFKRLGEIDKVLATGEGAGSTQIILDGHQTNDSILFLKGSVSTAEFTSGLFRAVRATPGASYYPMAPDNTPSTGLASGAYPGNDWLKFPQGDEFLAHIQPLSASARRSLIELRMQHLLAINDLLEAIRSHSLETYLRQGVTCHDR